MKLVDLQKYFSGDLPPRDHFVSILRHWEQARSDSMAFSFTDGEESEESLSYAELWDEVRGLAGYLQGRCGIRPGDRVLLLYPPGLDFVVSLFAVFAAGAIAVPAFPPRRNRKASRIRSIVLDADARWALSTGSVIEQLSGPDLHEDLVGVQLLGTDSPDHRDGSYWRCPRLRSDALGVLQYTSGSTGSPKGVMLTHENLIANSELILHAFQPDQFIVGASWLPTYHDMGLIGGVVMPMFMGRPNVLMSPMAFLQRPARWLQVVSKYNVTVSGGPNFAYQLCVDKIDDDEVAGLDLSSWEIAFNGAEPIRASTLDAFTQRFSKLGFRATSHLPCYGMAETTLIVTGGPKDNGADMKRPVLTAFDGPSLDNKTVRAPVDPDSARELVGCGRVLPGERIEIVDPDTRQLLPTGSIGEIWVQSPSVGRGYWQRREESNKTFAAMTSDKQGPFLRTGDLGFLHEGQLFVSGRLKDMIIVRGVNRYPQDIEETVERASDVVQAGSVAAFAMTDSDREQLVIVAETIRRRDLDWDDHLQSIRRAVTAEHDLPPDAVYLVRNSSVPKTSSGKIQRHACLHAVRDNELKIVAQWIRGEESSLQPSALQGETMMKAAAGSSGLNAPADPVIIDAIETHVRRVAGERAGQMSTDTNIVLDLGLDSLERLEIARSLERTFGGRFPEQVLDEVETIGQTAAAVERYLSAGARARAEAFLADPNQQLGATDDQINGANLQDAISSHSIDGNVTRPIRSVTVAPEDDVTQFTEYRRLKATMRQMQLTGCPNPYFTVHDNIVGDTTMIDGETYISFASYNYLGLSGHPEVSAAASDAIAQYGTSVSASRLVSGEKPIHGQLERRIAEWVGVDAAITMVGGHATNETTIGHLVGPEDLILHDALSHNSIVQGALLSGAKRRPFPHNDYEALDRMLTALRHQYRRTLVVIEGVYSMDGDFADVPKFIEIKKRHRCMLMVDEAHSFGTMGKTGHGIAEHFGINPKDVDIWMGTLSKSASSCGGYIAGSHALVELLRYTAPGFVFSVGMPPSQVAAAIASLDVLEREPERVERLRHNSQLFLSLCRKAGLDTGDSGGTPVVPVITGNSLVALRLSNRLKKDAINVQPILYPAVDESAARLRFFITSEHSEEQIRFTVDRTQFHYNELQGIPATSLAETG
ncbi:aminotransferase class I/II-fold pyridoxal phosphate-dependent enzyme [Rhodopirellula sp. SWK7]|uniref:aminotransferase class I/II-fold pyridoxal phosphate-dependent enzyme n=1 Tax=Rhodopirellula sp. SWK7 TaxID=595460 RepID=UPI0002BE85C9|nr:Beta-ketoacyl synthase [Rhodopirellula sp. SWK7]